MKKYCINVVMTINTTILLTFFESKLLQIKKVRSNPVINKNSI